jgi:hypothetical protein
MAIQAGVGGGGFVVLLLYEKGYKTLSLRL